MGEGEPTEELDGGGRAGSRRRQLEHARRRLAPLVDADVPRLLELVERDLAS